MRGSLCILALLFLSLLPARVAQANTAFERVSKLAASLPFAPDWKFVLVSEGAWFHVPVLGKTNTAYSDLNTHTTYLREAYVVSATNEGLTRTLAHEAGHWLCSCADEGQADKWRDKILKGGTQK